MALALGVGMAAASLAAAGASAAGSIYQGNASRSAAEQAAENEKYQAMLNRDRAGIAQIQGEDEAMRRAEQIRRDISANNAAWAGSGLLVEKTGTLADVNDTSAAEGWRDIATIRDNTALNVWGYKTNAISNDTSAESLIKQGKTLQKAGYISGAGSLLGGISSAASAGNSGYELGKKIFK